MRAAERGGIHSKKQAHHSSIWTPRLGWGVRHLLPPPIRVIGLRSADEMGDGLQLQEQKAGQVLHPQSTRRTLIKLASTPLNERTADQRSHKSARHGAAAWYTSSTKLKTDLITGRR